MNDLLIYDSDVLNEVASGLRRLSGKLDEVSAQLRRVDTSGEWWTYVRCSQGNARSALITNRTGVDRVQDQASALETNVRQVQSTFEREERAISQLLGRIQELEVDVGSGQGGSSGSSGQGGDAEQTGTGFFSFFGDWFGYEFAEDHPGITAWIGKISASVGNEWAHAGVNAYLGKAEAEAKLKGSLMEYQKKKKYKDGKWTETESFEILHGEASAGASVSILAADINAGVGNDMLGLEVKGEGSAGNAKAEVKGEFSIGEDGVNALASGKAMVSAVEGKASGTINILGFEITGKVGGYAGAAGVEGKIGIDDNKFVMEGGVAALVGVSGGIEIGFNSTGWEKFVDFITFWD